MPRKTAPKHIQESSEDSKDLILLDQIKPHWYVIQTYVGFEDVVKQLLLQKVDNLSLQSKIHEIYVPSRSVIKLNSKGERKEKVEKIYPGYIYIQMILDKETGYILQNTNYVSKIASTGNVATPLDAGYVESLKIKLDGESLENKTISTTQKFNSGDTVKVVDGPFKDMTGKVSSVELDGAKMSVLLSIFDRETEVLLDVLEVVKI